LGIRRREVVMFSKKMFRFSSSVLGVVFALALLIGLSGDTALAGSGCPDDDEFTTEFFLGDCGDFANEGTTNPFYPLEPGYKLVLESEDERAVITVLDETKEVVYDDIVTRVVEERALEWDDEEEEWVVIEISSNWFAICNRTNAVYYFGEWSRDCEDGFDENDDCTGEESNAGSWEAGVNGALPGLIMPGTFLLGSKYFQEIAEEDGAVDRGENVEMGLTWPLEDDLEEGEEPEFTGCVKVVDTNPAEGVCKEKKGDVKIYCPGVGLVMDEELELVCNGYDDGCSEE
jgi:hypothetical protein